MPDIKVFGIVEEDTVNYPKGFSLTVFCQGCTHPAGTPHMDENGHCYGCHNPDSHSLEGGTVYSTERLFELLKSNPQHSALVLSGGEPMIQAEALIPLCRQAKEAGYAVWVYSGYTFEQLLTVPHWEELSQHVDILVDGPFIPSLKSYRLKFRGSKNQRILDVAKSMNKRQPVLKR